MELIRNTIVFLQRIDNWTHAVLEFRNLLAVGQTATPFTQGSDKVENIKCFWISIFQEIGCQGNNAIVAVTTPSNIHIFADIALNTLLRKDLG